MANQWVRLWVDMPNDPKWRTIARISKQPIGNVIAVYCHMLTMAANADERGRTQGWSDEDIASALDVDTESITAIREAMQGRVLDDDKLTGWDKRQPLREDGAADRSKGWRESQKAQKIPDLTAPTETRTQPNATERKRRTDKDKDKINNIHTPLPPNEGGPAKRRTRTKAVQNLIPFDWAPPPDAIAIARQRYPEMDIDIATECFRDHWLGGGKMMADWLATWRNGMSLSNDRGWYRLRGNTPPQDYAALDRAVFDRRDALIAEGKMSAMPPDLLDGIDFSDDESEHDYE